MNYRLEFSKEFTRIFIKLQKKSKTQAEAIIKKIREIKANPEHFKPLSNKLKGYRRVHIESHFVLVYKIAVLSPTQYDDEQMAFPKIERLKAIANQSVVSTASVGAYQFAPKKEDCYLADVLQTPSGGLLGLTRTTENHIHTLSETDDLRDWFDRFYDRIFC